MPKATNAQTAQRIDELASLILDGASRRDIVAYVREQEKEIGSAWAVSEGEKGLCDSMIRRLTARATDAIVSSLERSRRRNIAVGVARRERLYATAVNQNDVKTALACLREVSLLRGEYDSPLKPKHTGDIHAAPARDPLPPMESIRAVVNMLEGEKRRAQKTAGVDSPPV